MALPMQLMLLSLRQVFILDYLSGHTVITRVLKIEKEGRGECQRDSKLEKEAGERQSMKKTRPASVVSEDRGRGLYAKECIRLQNQETTVR